METVSTCAGEPERAGWCDPVVSSVSVSDCSDPSGGPAGDHKTSATSGISELQKGIKGLITKSEKTDSFINGSLNSNDFS